MPENPINKSIKSVITNCFLLSLNIKSNDNGNVISSRSNNPNPSTINAVAVVIIFYYSLFSFISAFTASSNLPLISISIISSPFESTTPKVEHLQLTHFFVA